jgi:hypothetical protein
MSNPYINWDQAAENWIKETARVEEALYRHNQRERAYEYRKENNFTWLLALGAGLIAVALLLFGGL